MDVIQDDRSSAVVDLGGVCYRAILEIIEIRQLERCHPADKYGEKYNRKRY